MIDHCRSSPYYFSCLFRVLVLLTSLLFTNWLQVILMVILIFYPLHGYDVFQFVLFDPQVPFESIPFISIATRHDNSEFIDF